MKTLSCIFPFIRYMVCLNPLCFVFLAGMTAIPVLFLIAEFNYGVVEYLFDHFSLFSALMFNAAILLTVVLFTVLACLGWRELLEEFTYWRIFEDENSEYTVVSDEEQLDRR